MAQVLKFKDYLRREFFCVQIIGAPKRTWSAVLPMTTRHQGNARCSGSSQNGVLGCLGIQKTNLMGCSEHSNDRKMEETFDERLQYV